MNITEVRVKMVSNNAERLKAFCSVTLDGAFVIRDLKIIEGTNGPFVAMPSRKLADRCPGCGGKNHLRARFCNECGTRLREDRAPRDEQGRIKLHADVAHPINAICREQVQKAVVESYLEEAERAKHPDYRPAAFEEDDYGSSEFDEFIAELREPAARKEGKHRTMDRAGRTEPVDGRASEPVGREAAEQHVAAVPAKAPQPPPARKPKTSDAGDGFAAGIL